MQADGLLGLEALVKLVALQHLRNGEVRREPDRALVAQLAQPLGVVADLGRLLVENLEDLLLVGLGILVDLLARQRLARHVAPGRVADQRGKVADQEDDRVPQLLKVPQLAHQHGVAQVQVGRSRDRSPPSRAAGGPVLRLSSRRSRRSVTRIISAAPFCSRSICSSTGRNVLMPSFSIRSACIYGSEQRVPAAFPRARELAVRFRSVLRAPPALKRSSWFVSQQFAHQHQQPVRSAPQARQRPSGRFGSCRASICAIVVRLSHASSMARAAASIASAILLTCSVLKVAALHAHLQCELQVHDRSLDLRRTPAAKRFARLLHPPEDRLQHDADSPSDTLCPRRSPHRASCCPPPTSPWQIPLLRAASAWDRPRPGLGA